MKVPYKTKNRTTIWLRNMTSGHTPREDKNSKGYMHSSVHCSTIYNTQGMAATWMSINRWMDKGVGYTQRTVSHKKEWTWVICRDTDGTRACHTEWSKSDREKQVSYIDAYTWEREKWFRWIYLQDRNRDADTEDEHVDTGGKGTVGQIGRLGLTYLHYHV